MVIRSLVERGYVCRVNEVVVYFVGEGGVGIVKVV